MVAYKNFRINPYSTVVAVSDFEAKLGLNNWAKIGRNTFLLRNEKGKIRLFELVNKSIYDLDFYDTLPEGAPFELLNGKLIFTASPKDIHQKIAFHLTLLLGNFIVRHQLGEMRFAPFDVRLNKKNSPQPDLLFVSNARTHIIEENGLHGAPDLAIEIISRSTGKRDRTEKKDLYAQHGTQEYWIVDPEKMTVELFENDGQNLVLKAALGQNDTLRSTVLAGFEMPLSSIF